MDAYTAVGIAEGFVESESEEQVIEAWQFLVDSGMAWTLQGWFGRQADEGLIHRPTSANKMEGLIK